VLDRELIRQQPDLVRAGIARKGLDASVVDQFLSIDSRWRATATELQTLQAEANRASKGIGALMAQAKTDPSKLTEVEAIKQQVRDIKDKSVALETSNRELEEQLHQIELEIPNLPHASMPDGKTEAENVTVREWGTPCEQTRPHWEITEALGMVDFPRGAKISGSGFPVYTGIGARLQRSLYNFYADFQVDERGYQEVYPPVLVNRESLVGTGQLPKFEEDLYRIEADDLFLVPTAEVPITNLYRDEILEPWQLPIRHAGYSPCFRREAGAAGKDTRGLQRLHQFDKVELVKFTTPESSYEELELMVTDAEAVLQALGLPYRVIEICTGDIGAKGSKQYDLEVWSAGLQKWLEVSSCSNFESYQSRRANIRYRPNPTAKPEFVHILNGSGLAVPRVFAALLEHYVQEDGSVSLPEPLHRYMNRDSLVIEPPVIG
jgi:seryl-tRNA synthetase